MESKEATVKDVRVLLLSLLILGGGTCPVAWGEDAEGPDAKTLKASGIELDIKKHEVRLDATVCLDRGILEYLVCLPGTFEHEAVFSTKCKPSQLHLALLAIGLVPCSFAPEEEWWAKARENKQARVNIEVEYEQEGKKQRRRISEFLVNRERKDGVVSDSWVFTGSFFYKEDDKNHYAADSTGAVIGLWVAGASVLQYGERAGIPYRGADQGMEINTQTTPAKGTKVRLIFAPHADKSKQAEQPKKDSQPTGDAKP
ncbi:MAG: YdjY domain-containing protein [Planctomycetota bacterium]|nr:YdjY domain-containing protein [Planctomycetota bacterium]